MTRGEFINRLTELIRLPEASMDKAIEKLADDIFTIKKRCSSCGVLYPRASKWFAAHPNTKDKLQSYCRECGNRGKAVRQRLAKKQEIASQELDYIEEDEDYGENLAELDYREPTY